MNRVVNILPAIPSDRKGRMPRFSVMGGEKTQKAVLRRHQRYVQGKQFE